jgi:probable F420-dependent oxidoreductase
MNSELPSSLASLAGTVGIWTSTHESVPAAQSAQIAQEIESCGFSALWIPEAWGREAFSSAALLLAGTSTLMIATGIANIWGRDAVAAAAASRTLNAAYDNRFVLGLGVSHQPLVERLRGHEYKTPLVAMTEYLAALDTAPMFAPEGQQPFARVIAALGPKMLALAATAAHGAHPYLVTPEHTAIARTAVGDKFVGVEQAVVLGESREEFLARAHAHLEIYTGLENYRNSWKRLGFSEEDFVRGGSDRLCDALVVHGDEQAIVDRVSEHQQAGADHVCLQVLGSDLGAVPREQWQRIGAAISH